MISINKHLSSKIFKFQSTIVSFCVKHSRITRDQITNIEILYWYSFGICTDTDYYNSVVTGRRRLYKQSERLSMRGVSTEKVTLYNARNIVASWESWTSFVCGSLYNVVNTRETGDTPVCSWFETATCITIRGV